MNTPNVDLITRFMDELRRLLERSLGKDGISDASAIGCLRIMERDLLTKIKDAEREKRTYFP